jgi:hypothetical protein
VLFGLKEKFMLEIPDSQIRPELSKDETLSWAGQPKQGILFRSSDVFLIPFSLMWGGFAIFWEFGAVFGISHAGNKVPTPIGIIFPLFGIPFVIIGLYFIFGRFIVDAKHRTNTYYGLTDQRIIIVSGIFSRKVKSMNLRTLTDISLDEKANGTGTITFGPTNPMAQWNRSFAWPGMTEMTPSFEMIQNAKEIYEKTRNAQSQA